VERGAWTASASSARRIWEAECAVQRSATRPRARQGQPGPVKGSGWVEEQAAWSCWIARPEGDDSRRVAVRSTPAMHLQRPKRRGQAGVGESRARQPEPQVRLGKGKRGRGGGPPLLSGSRRAWSSVRKRAGRGQWARSVGKVGQCWLGLARVGGWWLVVGGWCMSPRFSNFT
jgi:hypothetical protein